MNKIIISKDKLRELYEDKKLSTRAIAKIYNCSQGVVLRELKDYNIEIRRPSQEIKISKEKLEELYSEEGFSTYKIAKIYNCDNKTVYRKLKQYNIKTRSIIKIPISKEELNHLYHIKKWPLSRIAKKFSCCVDPVFNRMKAYKIPARSMSEAKTIYSKKDFSGNLIEKAYLIGFRLGDLNVYRNYCSICIQSSTTITKQVELIKKLFDKYCNVTVGYYKDKAFHIQIRLNNTFEFLLPKHDLIEDWILSNDKYFIAFLAGYTDAEGNIQTFKNRLRIRIRSCDKNLLYLAHQKLKEMEIHNIYRLELRAGIYKHKKLNKDFWSLSINRQEDITKLAELMLPHLNHARKRKILVLYENRV